MNGTKIFSSNFTLFQYYIENETDTVKINYKIIKNRKKEQMLKKYGSIFILSYYGRQRHIFANNFSLEDFDLYID